MINFGVSRTRTFRFGAFQPLGNGASHGRGIYARISVVELFTRLFSIFEVFLESFLPLVAERSRDIPSDCN